MPYALRHPISWLYNYLHFSASWREMAGIPSPKRRELARQIGRFL